MSENILRAEDGKPAQCLYIGNIPKHATKEVLISLLNRFGTIKQIRLKKAEQHLPVTFAHVTFATSAEAFRLHSYCGLRLYGKKLFVSVADVWHQPSYGSGPNRSIELLGVSGGNEHEEEDEIEPPVQDCAIAKLNDDCLLHILEFIPFSQRHVFGHVCQQWRTLMSSYWSKFTCLNFADEPFNCLSFSNIYLERYLRLCPNITSVYLHSSDYACPPNSTSIIKTAELCPRLEELVLSEIDIIGRPLAYVAYFCKNLNSLTLTSCHFEKVDGHLFTIMKRFLNLSALTFEYCKINPGDWPKTLPTQLKSLKLVHCSISKLNNFLEGLDSVQGSLQELVLLKSSSQPLNFNALRNISSLERLVYMNGNIYSQPTSVDMFQNLKSLELVQCDFLSDSLLQGLVLHSPDLNFLNIAFLEKGTVSSEGYKTLADLKELKKLNLSDNDIEDDALIVLTEKAKNLEVLILCNCQNISNVGCESVVQNLMKLKEFNVEDCRKVSNKTVDAAVKAAIHSTNKVKLVIFAAGSAIIEVCNMSETMVEVLLVKDFGNNFIIYPDSIVHSMFFNTSDENFVDESYFVHDVDLFDDYPYLSDDDELNSWGVDSDEFDFCCSFDA